MTVTAHTYPRLQISGITRIEVGVIDVILRLAGGNGRGGLRARGRIAETLDSGHFVVLPMPWQNLEELVWIFRSEQGRLTNLMINPNGQKQLETCDLEKVDDARRRYTFSTTAGDRYFRSTLSIFDRVKDSLPI